MIFSAFSGRATAGLSVSPLESLIRSLQGWRLSGWGQTSLFWTVSGGIPPPGAWLTTLLPLILWRLCEGRTRPAGRLPTGRRLFAICCSVSKLSSFRSIRKVNGRFPSWVQALAGKSGVYVIKGSVTGRVLYVGESHSGRLQSTLTRHFQRWKGPTAGVTYAPGLVRVSVRVLSAARARAVQEDLIRQMNPRDNTNRYGDEVPF